VSRARSVHACTRCGAQQPRWVGRCPECGAWGSLVEEALGDPAAPSRDLLGAAAGGRPRRLAEIDASEAPRIPTGISELDRVLGGGLVPGSVVLLAGEPGVGKSTLGLQLAARAATPRPILYVTGEESPEQLRLRAERLDELPRDLAVLAETRVEALAEPWRDLRPAVVVIDSIQTLRTDRVESAPGSVAQVRESAALLAATAKAHGTALVLVGHVTKEGLVAGPRVLEHMVDAVLSFEGDRSHAFRVLRATKNRYGSTREVGVFAMTGAGLETVENPSELFLAERRVGAPGSCIVPLVEGSRPMLVEVQALVAPAGYGTARRTCLGIDDGRVALLLAVLDRRTDVDFLSRDVYLNAAGGVRVGEPGADLGVALALVSSRLDLPLPPDAAACGEIGLGGEVRRIGRTDLRIREASRLGFRRLLVPDGTAAERSGAAEVIAVRDVAQAVAWLRRAARTPVHDLVTDA
jgi:DNA repair protein RadA/Sms